MKKLLLLSIVLAGCGQPVVFTPATPQVDPELQPYYETFIQQGQMRGIDLSHAGISLSFVSVLPDPQPGFHTLGECFMGLSTAIINDSTWPLLNDYDKEDLVAHELGHCLLNRNHRFDSLPSGIYASIMYPDLLPTWMYVANRNYYWDELFYNR